MLGALNVLYYQYALEITKIHKIHILYYTIRIQLKTCMNKYFAQLIT